MDEIKARRRLKIGEDLLAKAEMGQEIIDPITFEPMDPPQIEAFKEELRIKIRECKDILGEE